MIKIFHFFCFIRDPNSTKTLQSFEDSITWAADGNFAVDDIEEAKLSVFAAVGFLVIWLIFWVYTGKTESMPYIIKIKTN